jgi:hypothetical protein
LLNTIENWTPVSEAEMLGIITVENLPLFSSSQP